jgi:hypothetical protein
MNFIKRVNKKAFLENIDLLQIISAYCQINDATSTNQLEFDKLISYVKVLIIGSIGEKRTKTRFC